MIKFSKNNLGRNFEDCAWFLISQPLFTHLCASLRTQNILSLIQPEINLSLADLHKFGINHVGRGRRTLLILMSIPLLVHFIIIYLSTPRHYYQTHKHRKRERDELFSSSGQLFLPACESVKNAPSALRARLQGYVCFYLWALI